MIFAWLRRRRELRQAIRREADILIALYGDRAYYEARDRARKDADPCTRSQGDYWRLVKAEVKRRGCPSPEYH